MNFKFGKKGQVTFGSLSSIVILVGIAAVIGVVMSILIGELQDDQTNQSVAWNVSDASLGFFNNLSDQWTLLGTVIGLVLVVSVVLAVFRFRGGGGAGI